LCGHKENHKTPSTIYDYHSSFIICQLFPQTTGVELGWRLISGSR